MPFGADDVVGVIALSLTCFHGCVQGLTILSKARHYTNDTSCISLQIELVQHSLQTWAENASLSNQPPQLFVSADKAQLVLKVLRRLQALSADLEVLKKKYGLILKPAGEDADLFPERALPVAQGRKQRRFTNKAEGVIPGTKARAWTKLRWVAVDDKKIDRLLARLKMYIQELEKLLDPQIDARRRRAAELYHLERILATENQAELKSSRMTRARQHPRSRLRQLHD